MERKVHFLQDGKILLLLSLFIEAINVCATLVEQLQGTISEYRRTSLYARDRYRKTCLKYNIFANKKIKENYNWELWFPTFSRLRHTNFVNKFGGTPKCKNRPKWWKSGCFMYTLFDILRLGGTLRKIWRHICASRHTGWETLTWRIGSMKKDNSQSHIHKIADKRPNITSSACISNLDNLNDDLILYSSHFCYHRRFIDFKVFKNHPKTDLFTYLLFKHFTRLDTYQTVLAALSWINTHAPHTLRVVFLCVILCL